MKKKRFGILMVFILILIITSIIIAVNNMYPETEASDADGETITVRYSAGEFENAFSTVTGSLTSDSTSGYVTFPETFIDTVGSVDSSSYSLQVDDETYYFLNEEDTEENNSTEENTATVTSMAVSEETTTIAEEESNTIEESAVAKQSNNAEENTTTEESNSTGENATEEINNIEENTVTEVNNNTEENTVAEESNNTEKETITEENAVTEESTATVTSTVLGATAVAEEGAEEEEEETEYSYTFVGWKIKDTSTATPTETVFQPGDYIDIETLKNYASGGVVELEALWAKVIYAQNPYETMYYTDYWIYDKDTTVSKYAETGAWNYKYENEELTLNLGNDVENPVCSLDYAYYLIYQMEYENNYANNTSTNAYKYVIMLTGDLDYCKSSTNGSSQTNFFVSYDTYDGTYDSSKHYIFGDYVAQQTYWGYFGYYTGDGTLTTATSTGVTTAANNRATKYGQSVTFKSKGDNTYSIKINGLGYYDYTFGSIRIDNVKFAKTTTSQKPNNSSPVSIATETFFKGGEGNYVEFTVRSSSDAFTFRTGAVQTVVMNGGTMNTWETSYTSSQTLSYAVHWYLGGTAKINNAITLGLSSTGETNTYVINHDFVFTMSGGTAGSIRGASAGLNTTSTGTRTINIIGDGTSTTSTSPTVTNVYGGAYQGILTGDTYVNVKGTVNVKNIYGGGYAFTATTYGNTNVTIENCSISGNVFAGGYNGNVEKNSDGEGGNATLNISDSTIGGDVYGSGMGGTQTLTTLISYAADQTTTDWQSADGAYAPDYTAWASVRNTANNDNYGESWNWEYPASSFPFVQDETYYICIAIYKSTTWTNNNPQYITFQRNYIYAYLSLAIIENDVNISIDGSTINGSVYGGGSVAVVKGNTNIEITGNSKIEGSVYGGGDGATQPSTVTVYKPISSDGYTAPSYTITKSTAGNITNVTCSSESSVYSKSANKYSIDFSWSSDTSLLDTNGIDEQSGLIYSPNVEGLGLVEGNTSVTVENSTVTGNIVAGGNASDVTGSTTLSITNTECSNIYGGGYSGNVGKNSYVTIDGITATAIYGGGYSGNVEGSAEVTINDGNVHEVFGGGYSGSIGENTKLTVVKGTYTNIFGGCDQNCVGGNTEVYIGNENNTATTSIQVSGVVYGGGRGVIEEGETTAQNYETVKGNSNVTIAGIYTTVENYGSLTLGSVTGDVYVTFSNYWSGNATSKYKTMNGIDRATTVSLVNSYVLLTNDDGVGIKSITNLKIPEGSGLKLSADSEISGDLEGGGELYLDSLLCLTVGGNISGVTTLTLNPELLTQENVMVIYGGIDQPYIKVNGEDLSGSQAIVSGERLKYTIYKAEAQETSTGYIHYYIEADVYITSDVNITAISEADRIYTGDIDESDDVYLLGNSTFSCDININWYLSEVEDEDDQFINIDRKFALKTDKDATYTLPVGTEICMVVDGEYYFFVVTEEISEIDLSSFIDSNGETFIQVSNFQELRRRILFTEWIN